MKGEILQVPYKLSIRDKFCILERISHAGMDELSFEQATLNLPSKQQDVASPEDSLEPVYSGQSAPSIYAFPSLNDTTSNSNFSLSFLSNKISATAEKTIRSPRSPRARKVSGNVHNLNNSGGSDVLGRHSKDGSPSSPRGGLAQTSSPSSPRNSPDLTNGSRSPRGDHSPTGTGDVPLPSPHRNTKDKIVIKSRFLEREKSSNSKSSKKVPEPEILETNDYDYLSDDSFDDELDTTSTHELMKSISLHFDISILPTLPTLPSLPSIPNQQSSSPNTTNEPPLVRAKSGSVNFPGDRSSVKGNVWQKTENPNAKGKLKLASATDDEDKGFLNRKLSDSLSRTKAISHQQMERLCAICADGDFDACQSILKDATFLTTALNGHNLKGFTPLCIACLKGDVKIVTLLLNHEQFTSVNVCSLEHKQTPLHLAAMEGHEAVVALLLAKKADTTLLNKRGKTARLEAKGDAINPFLIHDKSDWIFFVQMYPFVMDLKYTDPSLIVKKEHVYWNAQQIVTNKTNFCTAPLAQLLCDYIEEHNTLGITNLLTNKFAPQFVNLNAKKGLAPLHTAAEEGIPDIIIQLLKISGVNPNVTEDDGNTPLHIATVKRNIHAVALLLAYGADMQKENHMGKTPKQSISKKLKEKGNEEFHELAQRNIVHATYSLYEKEGYAGLITYFPIISDVTPLENKSSERDLKKKVGKVEAKSEPSKSFMIKKLGRPKINSLDIPAYRRTSPKDKMHYESGSPINSVPKSAESEVYARALAAIDTSVFLTPGGYPLSACDQVGAYGFEVASLRVVNVKDGCVLLLQGFNFWAEEIYFKNADECTSAYTLIMELISVSGVAAMATTASPALISDDSLCASEFARHRLDPAVWTINNKMIILASLSKNLIDLLKSFYSLNWFPSYTWSTLFPDHKCHGNLMMRCWRPNLRHNSPKQAYVFTGTYYTHTEAIYTAVTTHGTHKNIAIFDSGLVPPAQSVFLNGYVKELVFVNITHSDILDAFEKLFVTVLHSKNNHSDLKSIINELEGAENNWVPLKRRILEVTDDIVKRLANNTCIIIQGDIENPFADSIISVLVQLKVDSYFRSVHGFVSLLKKDWFVKGSWELSQKLGPSFYILFFLFISLLVDVVKRSPESFEFNVHYLYQCLQHFLRAEFINSSETSEHDFQTKTNYFLTLISKPEYATNTHFIADRHILPVSCVGREQSVSSSEDLVLQFHPIVLVSCFNLLQSFLHHPNPHDVKVMLLSHDMVALPADIRKYPEIHSLAVQDGHLSDLPPELASFANLVELSLPSNKFTFFPDPEILRRLDSLQVLDLSENRIAHCPSWLSTLTSITSLVLDGNRIEDITAVCKMTSLKVLKFERNYVSFIPPEISKLTELNTLNCNSNQVANIPESFLINAVNLATFKISSNCLSFFPEKANLRSLSVLAINDNSLHKLPVSLSKCQNLRLLMLHNNSFTEFPKVVRHFTSLEVLDASNNKIKYLPYWIGSMHSVKSLNLSHNKIAYVSHALSYLTRVERINLVSNMISELPGSLAQLKHLKYFNVTGNFLPPEYNDFISQPAQLMKQLSAPDTAYDAITVLAIGEPLSGKTSAINKLIKSSGAWERIPDDCSFDEQQILSLPLICYSSYFFKVGETKKQENTPSLLPQQNFIKQNKKTKSKIQDQKQPVDTKELTDNRRVKVTFLDFNSQFSLESSYEFFTRNDSLVVLTIDITGPKPLARLKYWFALIQQKIASPRVIILFTFTDNWLKSQTKDSLIIACNELVEQSSAEQAGCQWVSFQVSCDFDAFAAKIVTYLRKTKNIRRPLTLKQYHLKELLQQKARAKIEKGALPVISFKRYCNYASSCGFDRSESMIATAHLFHDAGLLLFEEKRIGVCDSVIVLSLSWLAMLISQIFLFKKVSNGVKNGIIGRNIVDKIFRLYPHYTREGILELLVTLQICVLFKKKAEVLIFVPLLFKELPAKEHQVPDLTGTEETLAITRLIKFTVLPIRFFHALICFVFTQELAVVKHISAWPKGITLTLSNATVVEFEIQDKSCLKVSVTGNIKNQNKIRLEFSNIINLIFAKCTDILTGPNLKWEPYFILNDKWYYVSALDVLLEDVNTDVEFQSTKINLLNYIPERFILTYAGSRHKFKDIQFVKELGKGSFATVNLAVLAHQKVAVKVLHQMPEEDNCQSVKLLVEFRNEIDILSQLNHPNLLLLKGIVLQPFCIITEFCEHGNLHDYYLNVDNPFYWELRLKISKEIASALQYLHGQTPPIAHIDIKGANILVSSLNPNDQVCVKIADFGTSQSVAVPITINKGDNPIWQAPEILNLEPYDERVDTYGMGVLFWEMVARKTFFGNIEFTSEIAHLVSIGRRESLDGFAKICPAKYIEVIEECWHQLPSSRPSMPRVLQKLSEITMAEINSFDLAYNSHIAQLRAQLDPSKKKQIMAKIIISRDGGAKHKKGLENSTATSNTAPK